MKWIEARITYTAVEGLLCADLVAGLFYDMGLHGVLLQEPSSWPGAAGESGGVHAVIGYIPAGSGGRRRCADLRRRSRQLNFPNRLELRVIDDQDWSQLWKTHFKSLQVSPGLVVKPSWETTTAAEGQTVIEIDPGMAFGTGHHPTTLLSLQLIRTYLRNGDTLLDVGTGSGILAIAAVKSGSGRVVAVDSDETAVAVALENRQRNHIDPDRLFFICGRLAGAVKGYFDTVVANILPDVIMELLEQLDRVLQPAGVFIASGIPEQKAGPVIGKAQSRSFETLAVRSLDGWAAIAFRGPA